MRPFPSFSLGIVLLGFATIASVLASAITPSDDGSSLLARAVGGKYVGSRCQQNSDCYSDRCVPTDDSTSTYKTCRRQVANGGCFKNDNFLSRNCTAGQCGSSSGGVCKADVDCDRSACRNGTCVSLSLGQSCTSGDQCKTTTCSAKHKVCILSPALVPCQKADQCYSGQCVATNCLGSQYNEACNGQTNCGDAQCPDYNGCEIQPLLGSCRSSPDCGYLVCDVDKKCRKRIADYCKSDEECQSRNCVRPPPPFNPDSFCRAANTSTTTAATTMKSTSTSSKTTSSSKSSSSVSSTTTKPSSTPTSTPSPESG